MVTSRGVIASGAKQGRTSHKKAGEGERSVRIEFASCNEAYEHSERLKVTFDDTDFLIPRRRCTGPQSEIERPEESALSYWERRHASVDSPYEEPHWSLGSALKWIAERSSEAVDRLSIDEEAAQAAVIALHQALERGEIHATAATAADPIPRRLPPETWGTYQVCLEDDGRLLWPRVLHDSTERGDLLNVQLRRADVIQHWPPAGPAEATPPSTAAKEAACRGWLTQMISENPHTPRPKGAVLAEATCQFPGLTKRAFDRAWSRAIEDTLRHGPRGPSGEPHSVRGAGRRSPQPPSRQ
jgi:hypothetical protein